MGPYVGHLPLAWSLPLPRSFLLGMLSKTGDWVGQTSALIEDDNSFILEQGIAKGHAGFKRS